MISEQKILERIKQYKTNLKTEIDPEQRLYFSVRIAELEFVLDKPKVTFQIIGGTPEARKEVENSIKKAIETFENF